MTRKLYVGNLPWSTTETALRDLFAQTGEVTNVSVITDRETGQPRGFAFIEMANDDAARQAIGQLNGSAVADRMIIVAEARPQAPRSTVDGNRGDYNGGYRGGYGGGRRR
jgi:RNA recognition motif-containing protein